MFKKILFASTVSEACNQAAIMAFHMTRFFNADLDIFHVLGLPTRAYSQVVIDVKTRERVEIDDEYRDWVKEEIRGYYEDYLTEIDGRYRLEVAEGVPHREILRKARTEKPDLIVMGGSSAHVEDASYRNIQTGGTLQRVARAANCPVLVIARPSASFRGEFSRVLFCTDFSESSDTAFDYTLSLARDLGCELLIFNVLDVGDMEGAQAIKQDVIEEKLQMVKRRMRSRYAFKAGKFTNFTTDALEGHPYLEIVKYAREKQADLIVLGAHAGQSKASDDRMGGNIEQVVMRAGCPVLLVNRST